MVILELQLFQALGISSGGLLFAWALGVRIALLKKQSFICPTVKFP
jgi:hypothetical protein